MEKLGILGGMGPEATASLFSRIVSFTDAATDQEHLDITILNDPSIPDRTAHLLKKPGSADFTAPLQKLAAQLEASGCTVIAMPCSTAHVLIDDIAAPLRRARILNMPRLTAKAVKETGAQKTAILATDGTVRFGLYDQALADEGLASFLPSPATQADVMAVIYDHVKAGVPTPDALVSSIFSELEAEGCDAAILGCTELSVVGIPSAFGSVRVIDALDVLARESVRACGGRVKDAAHR